MNELNMDHKSIEPRLMAISVGFAEITLTRMETAVLLTDRDREKLLLVVAGDVARRRRERGVLLNYPESIALISAELLERARDGKSVAELMVEGTRILARAEVMEGVAEMIDEIQIEATFPDGSKLVTVHHPIQ